MTTGSSRCPPNGVERREWKDRVAMQMRLPVHVWAFLSQAREAESTEIGLTANHFGVLVKGVGCRERWREYDGERHQQWRDKEGKARARRWREWFVQRMEWVRKDGMWRGEWKWEEYDRLYRTQPRDAQSRSLIAASAPWGSVPQEVLLFVVRQLVSTYLPSVYVAVAHRTILLGWVLRSQGARRYLPGLPCVARNMRTQAVPLCRHPLLARQGGFRTRVQARQLHRPVH